MAGPEANLWQRFRAGQPPKTFLNRIENKHGGGVPDVFVCIDGHPLWIELKVAKWYDVVLSPHQVAWHTAYNAHGGLSFFLVSDPRSKKLGLIKGLRAVELHHGPWSPLACGIFNTVPEVWGALAQHTAEHYASLAALRPRVTE